MHTALTTVISMLTALLTVFLHCFVHYTTNTSMFTVLHTALLTIFLHCFVHCTTNTSMFTVMHTVLSKVISIFTVLQDALIAIFCRPSPTLQYCHYSVHYPGHCTTVTIMFTELHSQTWKKQNSMNSAEFNCFLDFLPNLRIVPPNLDPWTWELERTSKMLSS